MIPMFFVLVTDNSAQNQRPTPYQPPHEEIFF